MAHRPNAVFVCVLFLIAANIAKGDFQEILVGSYEPGGAGIAAIVVKDGDVLFEGASGMANFEHDIPVSKDSVFRIASVTKQFTAATILLLSEDGQLHLDDLITDYLPDYPTQGYKITITHLLNHTSGIANITDQPELVSEQLYLRDATTDELVDSFKDKPFDFVPGEDFRYNNSGYILLGAIMEKIAERPFHEVISERIFEPLGMDKSYYDSSRKLIKGRANAYDHTDEGIVNGIYLSMTRPHAAGSLMSTVGDLATWSEALFQGRLLTEESLLRMTTNHQLPDGRFTDYGYGLEVTDLFGRPMLTHTGGISGGLSITIWLPDERIFVAVLSNTGFHPVGPFDIAYYMAFETLGAKHPFDSGYEIDNTINSDFVGVYRLDEGETLTVTENKGELYAQPSGDDSYLILPFDEDSFFYPGYQDFLEFTRNTADQVTGVNIHFGPTEVFRFARREGVGRQNAE